MRRDVTLTLLLLLSAGISSAAVACDLETTIINQDPFPAVPGDYVKLVFQVTGLDSPNCNDITFELLSDYPLEFNPGENGVRTFKKLDFLRNFETNLLIPYEVRINKDALDGNNPIEVKVQSRGDAAVTRTFGIEVEDVRAEFEIYVKDYDYKTNEMTLEVLNIAPSDIEALTIEIPKQDQIISKGSNRIVVGDLDSNEYTSADFEASPKDGEFKVNLIYSDKINTRRTVEKMVSFDSSYFTERKADEKTTSKTAYAIYAVIIILLVWWGFKKFKKKKK
jgi:hypothetical protein